MLVPAKIDDKTITASNDQAYSTLKTNDGFEPLTLKVGTTSGPATLEPVDSWDTASNTVLNQVVETLFTYYLSDPNLPRVPYLAEGYWWEEDSPILHIILRQGIRFHDGTLLDATAVKWNFDRLLYLTDCTGTNTGQVAHTQSLWMFPDGVTPIIASVSTVGDWEVVLTLNGPYAPLLDLLCYINAGMLSPSSTPATEFIDLYGGQVIGTGPFKYEYFNPDVEVRFSRWDYYWRGPAYFEAVSFFIYPNYWEMHEAFIAHQLDYLLAPAFDNLPIYEADPLITVERFTEDTGIPGLVYRFLGFNNEKYDVTWRKAMSYAIDYTYIIEDLRGGNAIRANSPISPGFGAAYNPSATAATFDIDTARSIMQSMGYGIGFTTDDDWVSVAEGDSPFLAVPYTYNLGNTYREDLGAALTDWFKLIGIKVIDDGVFYDEFISYLYEDHDHLGIYELGWGPDFFEPFNMIYPLFSPGASTDTAQVDDPWLNAQLALALETVDDTARNDIYKDIQWYMAEEGYFHAYLWHPEVIFAHLTEIQGVPYNALEAFYAYPMYREMQQEFYLTSDAGEPDDDGAFTL
ncbi:MAG: ABC transporter substrate-binding protein, partial [Candidatus Hermodarchaeota archaeon]